MHARLLRAAVLVGLAAAMTPASAHAAVFTVTSTGDEPDASTGEAACRTAVNTCTLRAAIQQANAAGDKDDIVLPAGTYAPSTALPALTKSVGLSGAGARATVIDGVGGFAPVLDLNGPDQADVRGLTVTGGGQGIRVLNSDATLDAVAIRDNAITLAGSVDGVGLFLGTGASAVLSRSAVTGNRATSSSLQASGAGILVGTSASLTAVASTISGNVASGNTSFGGGILSFGGPVTLRHVTLVNNTATASTASQQGGNLYRSAGSVLTLSDTIIAGGQAAIGANCNGGGAPVVSGRNIDSGTTCGLPAGQLSSTDPQLETPGDAGGPTDSAALKPGSPARDAALACPDGGVDQRGAPAPAGTACDIGAVELGADLAVTVQASRPDVAPGGDVTYIVRVANNGADAAPGTVLEATAAGSQEVTVATASAGTCTTAVRCDLGTVARGATVTATIVARAGAGGSIALSARATSGLPDPTGADNAAGVTTPIASPADAADRTAPALGPLKLSGRARTGRAATLRASLSEAATVTLRIERLGKGRRSGGRCLATARRGKACTTARLLGTITIKVPSGTPKLTLPAKVRGRRLAPGRHRVTAGATDAAGNRSRPRTLTITVVR